jgi:hypothetical protein
MPLLKQSANLRECIKLPVVDVIFLAVYRWSKAVYFAVCFIEYFFCRIEYFTV